MAVTKSGFLVSDDHKEGLMEIVGAYLQPSGLPTCNPFGNTISGLGFKPAERVANPCLNNQEAQGQMGSTYHSSRIGTTLLRAKK